MTQRAFAKAVNVRPRTVERWEAGTIAPGLESQLDIASALDVPLSTIQERLASEAVDAPSFEAQTLYRQTGPESGAREPENPQVQTLFTTEDDTDRREFLYLAFAGPNVMSTALEAVRGPLFSISSGAAGKEEPTSRIDEWEDIVWQYGWSYRRIEPQNHVAELLIDIADLNTQIRQERDETRGRQLYRFAGSLSALMAMNLTRMGLLHPARRWWRTARQAADASADAHVRGWVRGREAITLLYTHCSWTRAVQLADEGIAIGGGARSISLAAKAQALALLGENQQARAVVQSIESVLEKMPLSVVEDSETAFGWAEARLRHTESYVYSHIGDLASAQAAQGQAMRLYGGNSAHQRGLISLHEALCMVHSGDIDHASETAMTALATLPNSQVDLYIQQLSQNIFGKIPPSQRGRAAVADFSEAISRATYPSDTLGSG